MNGNFQIKKREIRKGSRDLVFPSILVHLRTITFLYLKMSLEALISWKKMYSVYFVYVTCKHEIYQLYLNLWTYLLYFILTHLQF